MKPFAFSAEKNKWLKLKRGVDFEEIIKSIQNGNVLSRIVHPNKKKFPNQKMFLVKLKNYVYVIPYLESENVFFLKTLYPSRKYTKKYHKSYKLSE